VEGRKNMKFKESSLEYGTSSVKESTTEIEVYTNNSSSKDEVDLYALEVVPKSQEKGSSPDAIVRDEREIEKAISPISLRNGLTHKEINEFQFLLEIEKAISPILLRNGLTHKEINEFQFLLHKYHHLFAMSYKDLKQVTLEEHKIELL